ncbi:hypothetical protein C8Q79DRAFT_915917 [Trametes meyenii]|nr:hypothetical protein C8Q79DRAFT_915917 [Trametes meyenii]
MHNLFLGEFKHHCMHVFGIDTAGEKTTNKTSVAHTPTQQQSFLDRIRQAIMEGAESALVKIRRDYLAAVAEYNYVSAPGAKLTKSEYAAALIKWVMTIQIPILLRLPLVMEENASYFRLPGSDDISKEFQKYRDVFTGEVLKEVRSDITKTSLPSWMETPPRNLGSPSHGKLKADHWRTVGTVSLVITLIRLWGSPSASAIEREVLDNFVALAVAIDLATRRSMNPARAALYDQYMEKYLHGLRTLFGHSLVPNHHLSLHLRQCLDVFGPVHGWWAYPFERYNGILQRLNSNYKLGEMPLTFMRSFYKGATLRWLMGTIEWPDLDIYTDMVKAFDAAVGDVLRGTRVTDIIASAASPPSHIYNESREIPLPVTIYADLLRLINSAAASPFQSSRGRGRSAPRLPPDGEFVERLVRGGETFATRNASQRNSNIVFRHRHDNDWSLAAGQISQIFYHRCVEGGSTIVEPFFLVNEYAPLGREHEANDPYRHFKALHTKLYYNKFLQGSRLVRANDVISHFAGLVYTPENIPEECIVVRPLDRVCRFCSSITELHLMAGVTSIDVTGDPGHTLRSVVC